MGTYAAITICPREFREDVDLDAGQAVAAMVRGQLEAEGYHPAGDPRIDWCEISQQEIDLELSAQESTGIAEPFVSHRAGDWRVRVVFDVTEDAELPG
jgi:hypothetical protein